MNRRDVLLGLPASFFALRRSIGHAQDVITADVVAAWVQAFHDQTTTLQARFRQYLWNRVHRTTDSSSGRIAIQRPGRIRFDYEQPPGMVLASDGADWIFYQPIEGGAGQYTRGSSAAASTSALGFLMGTVQLTQFARSLRVSARTDPEHTRALELRPQRADPHYVRIVVYVDDRAESRGVVRRVSVEDPDGNWNRFDFSEQRFDDALDASTFRYTPPPGAREATLPRGDTAGR